MDWLFIKLQEILRQYKSNMKNHICCANNGHPVTTATSSCKHFPNLWTLPMGWDRLQ